MKKSLLLLAIGVLLGACDDTVTAVAGSVDVTTVTTGELVDADGYTVSVDGVDVTTIAVNGTASLELAEGSYSVELTDLAEPCVVEGDNPVSINVTASTVASVEFRVTC